MVLFVVAPLAPDEGPAPAVAQELPRVSFTAPPGGTILVEGTYPDVDSSCLRPTQRVLRARYTGRIEIGRDTDGSLFLIGELPFEEYLQGIAEVPRTWPMAALKAQVIAARTYAAARLARGSEEGDRLGYDLCATDACQVYRGYAIAHGPYGDRWRTAVEETRDEVLLTEGRPADTVYFSTSNGRTYGNEEVFDSDPVPYLRPVVERHDGASPVSRWRAVMPLEDVARFLRSAGEWPSSEAITSVRRSGPNIVVRGAAESRTMSVIDFRLALNTWAPCLAPSRYPGVDAEGDAMPQAVPSRWFGLEMSGGDVVMTGRGWGHGVGMVQWGAYGKAKRGWGYADILGYYYGGLRPERSLGPPAIRIAVAERLTGVRVSASRGTTVTGTDDPYGPWLVQGGEALTVTRSEPPQPVIDPPGLRAPGTAEVGAPLNATVTLPELSVVWLALGRGPGEVRLTPEVTRDAGTFEVRVPELPVVVGGTHQLYAVASDGVDIVRSAPVELEVEAPPWLTSPPSPSPPTSPPPPTASPPADTVVITSAPAAARPDWERRVRVGAGLVGVTAVGVLILLALLRRRARS